MSSLIKLGLWCLTPLSTIFPLHRGVKFYGSRKPEYVAFNCVLQFKVSVGHFYICYSVQPTFLRHKIVSSTLSIHFIVSRAVEIVSSLCGHNSPFECDMKQCVLDTITYVNVSGGHFELEDTIKCYIITKSKCCFFKNVLIYYVNGNSKTCKYSTFQKTLQIPMLHITDNWELLASIYYHINNNENTKVDTQHKCSLVSV